MIILLIWNQVIINGIIQGLKTYLMNKGKKERPKNKDWPTNYHHAVLEAQNKLEERCYARGNNNIFTDKLKLNLYNWNEKIKDYHLKKLLIIQKNEYLEDVLKNNGIIN